MSPHASMLPENDMTETVYKPTSYYRTNNKKYVFTFFTMLLILVNVACISFFSYNEFFKPTNSDNITIETGEYRTQSQQIASALYDSEMRLKGYINEKVDSLHTGAEEKLRTVLEQVQNKSNLIGPQFFSLALQIKEHFNNLITAMNGLLDTQYNFISDNFDHTNGIAVKNQEDGAKILRIINDNYNLISNLINTTMFNNVTFELKENQEKILQKLFEPILLQNATVRHEMIAHETSTHETTTHDTIRNKNATEESPNII